MQIVESWSREFGDTKSFIALDNNGVYHGKVHSKHKPEIYYVVKEGQTFKEITGRLIEVVCRLDPELGQLGKELANQEASTEVPRDLYEHIEYRPKFAEGESISSRFENKGEIVGRPVNSVDEAVQEADEILLALISGNDLPKGLL